MQNFNINFTVPSNWSELSDKQLQYVYQLIADGNDAAELQTLYLLQWGGAMVVGRQPSGAYLLRKGKFISEITPTTIAKLLPYLARLADVPKAPVRLAKINRRDAIAANFQCVPFESYIVCDNLYQGYLQTQNESLLDQLANVHIPLARFSLRNRRSAYPYSIGWSRSKISSRAASPTSCNRWPQTTPICSVLHRTMARCFRRQ